ncbi:hypothetical protein L210DRAFT_3446172, partial [Boletus edulis BED1]
MLIDKGANDEMYAFFQKKVGELLKDPQKRELLAPLIPLHLFGCKHPSLEQTYYNVFNQDNVDIVNVGATPIIEVTPEGIKSTAQDDAGLAKLV